MPTPDFEPPPVDPKAAAQADTSPSRVVLVAKTLPVPEAGAVLDHLRRVPRRYRADAASVALAVLRLEFPLAAAPEAGPTETA